MLELKKKYIMYLIRRIMSLIGHVSEGFNATKQDPISSLPDELFLEVFSHLNLATLGTICSVSKGWKRLADDPILWKMAIYREIAFGNDKWAQCFGKDVVKDEDDSEEFSSLPWNDFIADCKKFKSIFPKKKARENLMLVRLPKTLNGKLTLKSLGELAKKYFPSDTGYKLICSDIIDELGDKSIDQSRWVLMTKDVLPGSAYKNYGKQQKMVAALVKKSLISYEVPGTLESVACILSQYFNSNIRLFSERTGNYTRCKDYIQDRQIMVGDFCNDGLCFYRIARDNIHLFEDGRIGVAVLRNF